ncbi:L-rhamnose mutarotase [Demequina sp. NBRC 110056]|uniref:L-rhamnose mutarotase n=1 Tax=Demequina sp. NBRC 110056 TaxID=1570345 RepID=UPI000A00F04F|nr:L-rhamnose mutarotase [Demequina sp. NBRC 110056]
MPRVCFTLQIKPELIDEYVERHRAVWPQMLEAIRDSGRRNYSIFLEPDGRLVGYYETDDDAASARRLAEDPRTADWERESARFFVALDGRPDQGAPQLTEVFHLEDQLDAAGLAHHPS